MNFGEWMVKFHGQYCDFIRDLIETGADAARRGYSNTENDEDSATVTAEVDGESGRVFATGDGISFLEFGAGTEAGTTGQTPVEAPYPIEPWSYSESVGSGFGKAHGFWYYKGKKYYSKTPTAAMQNASIEMQQRVGEIARRHFG